MSNTRGRTYTRSRRRTVPDTIHDAMLLVRNPPLRSARDDDEIEWQGGRVDLYLGAGRDDPPLA